MRLKLYRASCVTEAMARVRAELGPDALILATRRVAGGVEVTAALEPNDAPPRPLDLPPPPARPARQTAPGADPLLAATLAWHGVPAALAERLAHPPLAGALSAARGFAQLPVAGDDAPPLMVSGPPGAGKTLTIARLATRLVMGGSTPYVITTDGQRAGATEQLAAFTRLLGINLIVANQAVTLARALARRPAGAPVLIDTAGLDAFDPAEREFMAALAATADAAVALVMPAGLDPSESVDRALAHAEAGASLLVATRLDLARRLGGIVAAAEAGKLSLAEAGIGPGAADGLVTLTPALLADRLSVAGIARSPVAGPRHVDEARPLHFPSTLAVATREAHPTPPLR